MRCTHKLALQKDPEVFKNLEPNLVTGHVKTFDMTREFIICCCSWYCTAKSQPQCRQSIPSAPDQAIPYDIKKKDPITPIKYAPLAQPLVTACQSFNNDEAYLVDDEYLVTAFVPSDTACLASSPGRMSRTLRKSKRLRRAVTFSTHEVWISREEMVDFLLYAASLDASVATRSKISVNSIRRCI